MNHTPTPWYAGKPDSVGEIIIKKDHPEPGLSMTVLCKTYDEDKASHIVKCVNMHEELVEHLAEAVDSLEILAGQYGHTIKQYRPMIERIRATLAKAKGE